MGKHYKPLCDKRGYRPADCESCPTYIKRLQDEFAELRAKNDELRANNAELSALVVDMWHDMPKSETCGFDVTEGICVGHESCNGECGYWYRMRRLGIEVDDG